VEASALHAPAGFTRGRISIPSPLLRLRSDEQLVALFRAGEEEAFRIIHDRYSARLLAYARQMVSSRQDAEDILQEVFVRAYSALRTSDRPLALRAWLYRIAHNRCIDQLRRPVPPAPEALGATLAPAQDPVARAEERESLRRLVADLRRLPEQQRSALLMRELGGMSYDEVAVALGVSAAAVKSVLVRARVSLAQAIEARDTACPTIREELILAHDGRRRPHALARRHLRDCGGCRTFRREVRGVSRELAALAPALGPVAAVAKVLGVGGGGAAAGGSAAAGSGVFAGSGVLAGGLGHVVTVLAAAAVTAGGAVEIQSSLAPTGPPTHHASASGAKVAASTAASAVPVSAVQTVAAVVAAGTTNVAAQPTKSSATVRNHASTTSAGGATSNTTSSGSSGGAGSSTSSRYTQAPVDDAALDPSMGPGVSGSSSANDNSTGTSADGTSTDTSSSGTGGTDTSGSAGSTTGTSGSAGSSGTSGTGTGSTGSSGSTNSASAASGTTTPSSGASGSTNNGTITSSGSGSGSGSNTGTATLGVLKAGG
jgi:RNA polymerase sigma factor (sigma-70 family)